MSDDSEKRFQTIMDKLFHAPKFKPNSSSSSGAQSSKGKKRPNSTSALAAVEPKSGGNALQAPMCRPWDRGDLMRRLATFKSMTWFAKPKVVSAVNCASRGWINVEMDIIACEACGARLLFSTPSSWTQEQVEKAALVFSLKLDNGHKLLCPWIDNSCDEKLAQFPPTPSPVLVDGYRQRSFALLQLLALPVISSSAIDYMRSPQLEEFLRQSSMLEGGNIESANASETECLGNECEAASANMYHQAQKLISLCGWEPRSLPYIVDCKDQSNQSAKDPNLVNLSRVVVNGPYPSISVNSSVVDESIEANEEPVTSGGCQSDPNSVVLDCGLCGANVGLWAFSMVPRPLELFRVVGFSKFNNEKKTVGKKVTETCGLGNENLLDSREGVANNVTNFVMPSKDKLLNLNLTIAGGPPPAKQNFRATISLPIIGRNLRARFSSEFREQKLSKMTCVNKEDIGSNLQGRSEKDNRENTLCGLGETQNNENRCHGSVVGTNVGEQKLTLPETGVLDSMVEMPRQSMEDLGQNNYLPEKETCIKIVDQAVGDVASSQVGDSSMTIQDAEINNTGRSEDDSSMEVAAGRCQETPETDESHCNAFTDHQEPSSCMETRINVDCAGKLNIEKGGKASDVQKAFVAQLPSQDGNGIRGKEQTFNNVSVASVVAKYANPMPLEKAMEFDPVRQHRHFCPWIATTGSTAPGWLQTLSALQKQEEVIHHSPTNSPLSGSTIKVDDPISSIRKLFMSPVTKRRKFTHGSS